MKEVLLHIPTTAFQLVEWIELKESAKNFVSQWWSENHQEEIFKQLQHLLSLQDKLSLEVTWKEEFFVDSKKNLSQESIEKRKILGEKILNLYFLQLSNPNGLYLDLRLNQFHNLSESVKFSTSPLWYKFEDSFRVDLLNLYQAYYQGNDDAFDENLKKLRLTTNLNAKECQELRELFYAHFKGGVMQTSEIHFSLKLFQASFLKIFKFFLDHQIHLSRDFLFLGFYLITLYMSLEELNANQEPPLGFDVESIFIDLLPTLFPKK